VSFAAITLSVASQRRFAVTVVYFVIDSVRKLLDTPSYVRFFLCCLGRDLAMEQSPVQRVLSKCLNVFTFSEVNFESEQVRGPNAC
jgi:hypothetical protein